MELEDISGISSSSSNETSPSNLIPTTMGVGASNESDAEIHHLCHSCRVRKIL